MRSETGVSRRQFLGSAAGGALGMSLVGTSHAKERPFEPIHLSEPVSLWDLPTPALVVDLDRPPAAAEIHLWLAESNASVLNVAGPRESQNLGISSRAKRFLLDLLRQGPYED